MSRWLFGVQDQVGQALSGLEVAVDSTKQNAQMPLWPCRGASEPALRMPATYEL